MADERKSADESPPKPKAKSKSTRRSKAKSSSKTKSKTKSKAKAKTKSKAKAKTKSKAKAKTKSKAKTKTKSKTKSKAKPKPKAKAKAKARKALPGKAPTKSLTGPAKVEAIEGPAPLKALTAPEVVEVETLPEPPAEFTSPLPEPLPDLPVTRGRDFIAVMPRDPESCFIYWELTAQGAARARAALGTEHGQLTLRTYLLAADSDSDPVVWDHAVQDWLGRYVLFPDRAGRRVVAALGFKTADQFAHVARATAVHLPRRWPAAAPARFSTGRPQGPARVEYTPQVDTQILAGFHQADVMGAGVQSDLHRIVGADQLVDAAKAEAGHRVPGSAHHIGSASKGSGQ